VSSTDKRIAETGSCPVAGRPLFFRSGDFMIIRNTKKRVGQVVSALALARTRAHASFLGIILFELNIALRPLLPPGYRVFAVWRSPPLVGRPCRPISRLALYTLEC
jgi:hypothetical protein